MSEVMEVRRTSEKVNGSRTGGELTSHFLRLLRLGSETRAFLSSQEETRRDEGDYGSRGSVSIAAMDTECKKAQGTMAFQRRHRYV
jgi:hypothetical protein